MAARFADFGVFPNVVARDASVPGIPVLERPDWVVQCGEKVSAALFPQIRERPQFESKGVGYEGGFSIGLIEAGLRLFDMALKPFKLLTKVRMPTEDEIRIRLRSVFGEHGEWLMEVIKDDGKSFLESVEEYESGLDLAGIANFRQGQADALRMVAGENRKNDATDIYLFMMLYWRVVDRLDSVDHLHRVLTKVFGKNRVGYDPKRVAQICQRVGKRYRARGRPPKQPQPHWHVR